MIRTAFVISSLLILSTQQAVAHPHISVDAKAAITFDKAGEVSSVHNTWTFDEAYSSWAIQGLDKNLDGKVTREELQPLADDNMKGLADYGYYTSAGEGAANLKFVNGHNATIDYTDGRITLNFDVAVDKPYAIHRSLEIGVNDPEYYVAISFADATTVSLVNAPAACAYRMEAPHTMPDDVAKELYALPMDVTKLPPKLEEALRGVQGGIVIECKGGSSTGDSGPLVAETEATTALEAVNELGAASAAPMTASEGAQPMSQARPTGVSTNPPDLMWWLEIVAAGLVVIGLAVAVVTRLRRTP